MPSPTKPFEAFPGPPPRVPEPRALMLLHASGRSLFSGQRAAGQAYIRPSRTSSACDQEQSPITRRGWPPGESLLPGGHDQRRYRPWRISPQTTRIQWLSSLTSDQLLPRFSFLSLATPRLTYDDLERLLPRPIPDGWKLTVQGGRRRATHLEVHHRCTLLYGLVSVSVPDPPPEVSPASSPLFSQFATR